MTSHPPLDTAGPAAEPTVRDDVPIEAVDAAKWDALCAGAPLLSHAFFTALHATGCASTATGWQPRFLTAWRNGTFAGAMPLYAKAHSYGEYVFDWAWADAYRRHGARYYPKLVAAIPFTPTPGARLLAKDDVTRRSLLRQALTLVRLDDAHGARGYSSLHMLFPHATDTALGADAGMLIRHGVQFRWVNAGYRDFDDFLAAFSHDKRKKVKQERRRVAAAGITFEHKVGREISAADWRFFHGCYERTYHAHRSTPYLSLAFFERIGATMGRHLLLVLGRRAGEPVCAALDVFDEATLWGRYWGATEYVPGMHFEACFYQAIEFCLARRLQTFEGGAQGAHKLARGLVPVTTHSAHAIADPRFAGVIADYCARERSGIAHAIDELESASPYRTEQATGEAALG